MTATQIGRINVTIKQQQTALIKHMSGSELDLGPTPELVTLTILPYFPPFQNRLKYPRLTAVLGELYDTS